MATKNFHLFYFTGQLINNSQFIACKVNIELVTCFYVSMCMVWDGLQRPTRWNNV